MKSGIINKEMSIDQYHSSPGISSSGISLILDCPKRYWYEKLSGINAAHDSKAFLLGQALHNIVLEPNIFVKNHLILPPIDKRTREGKEMYAGALSTGKKLLKSEEYYQVKAMADSILSHDKFSKIIENGGNIETSLICEDEHGTIIKSRPDFYNEHFIVDIKTTDSAKKSVFSKKIIDYGYHRQAAMALDLLSYLTGKVYENFLIMAVEKTAPYLTAMYVIDKAAIEIGRMEYLKGVEIFRQCMQTNTWQGYQDDIEEISLPKWY